MQGRGGGQDDGGQTFLILAKTVKGKASLSWRAGISGMERLLETRTTHRRKAELGGER